MSKLKCSKCGFEWENGQNRPKCPNCLTQDWLSSPGMIPPKHDPVHLPSASPVFRSVVPSELCEQPEAYYRAIASGGTALYSTRHNGYCYVYGVAPWMSAGSAIPAGSAMPTRPMDAYLVADPFGSNPHIYAEDVKNIQDYIADNKYQLLPKCSFTGCDNRQLPGSQFCVQHMNPSKAIDATDDQSDP